MPLRTAILTAWGVFWVGWLISAAGAKRTKASGRTRLPRLGMGVLAVIMLRLFRPSALLVHGTVWHVVGIILFACGLGLAVWARIILGRNWGMPMSQKEEPELVTRGPYRYVRHPIYSGILLAMLGTAVASNLYWLILFGVTGLYFIYSARVEERMLMGTFPDVYPGYRTRTKMLIPFVL